MRYFHLFPASLSHRSSLTVLCVCAQLRRRKAGLVVFDPEKSSVPSTGETALRTAVIMDAVLRKFYRCLPFTSLSRSVRC
jgi:hypothetical protein